MNLRLENFVLFLWLVTDFGRTVLSFDSKCPPLKLVSGRSRYQWRGRSVRFNCLRSFQLVGVKYATCMNGKWDADVPICVKYGCRVPSVNHVNGQFIESYRGAVVKIVCNPGYSLIGSPSVYCNGIRWNETFPVCRVTRTNPETSCNFEDEDLCGWSQDPMHDFDWKRRNTTLSKDGVTFGKLDNTRGFYMYIEGSNSRSDNDTARLFSPVYPPSYSNGTCFKFLYRMYGNTTGFLKIYVKPEGIELWNIIPSFWISGDQGNSWFQRIFPIETMETPFQIVVEGIRGPGAAGDTAIDDVKLSREECLILETTSSSTESSDFTVNADDDITEYISCKNRCHEEKTNETDADLCHCYESCDRDGTCCSDYFDLCVTFASTPTPAATTTHSDVKVSATRSSPSTLPSIEPEINLPSPKPPPKHFNNESNEIDPGKPLPQIPPLTPSNRTLNDIHGPAHPTTPHTTPKTTTSPHLSKTTTTRNGTDVRTAVNASKTSNQKAPKAVLPKPVTNRTKSQKAPPNGVQVKAKAVVVAKSTSVTSSSTATTAARVFKSPNSNNIKLTFLDKPSRPILSNESRFVKGKQKELSGKDPPQAIKIDESGNNGAIPIKEIVEFGGTALAILVFALLGVFWYKRRAIRKTERDNMVEDCDSIIYEMESSTLGSEYHSLVCIRPGGLSQSP